MTSDDYTVNDLIRDELYKNMDMEYGKFQAKLIPNCGNIIGVRMPVLRSMGKEIAKVNWKEYLDGALDDTLEETLLQAIVLGYARGNMTDILEYLDQFIPKIDNWMVCDVLCTGFKIGKRYQQPLWELLLSHMEKGAEEFEMRFVVIMMMSHFLNEEYIDKVLYAYNTLKHEGYYFKMGLAWGLATAYAKFPGKAMVLLQDNDIEDDTYNMALKKMGESFRVSKEDKIILKSMKR